MLRMSGANRVRGVTFVALLLSLEMLLLHHSVQDSGLPQTHL